MIDFSDFNLNFAAELHGYGSFMNGFGTAGSDIDSMICTQSFIDERQILYYIQFVYKVTIASYFTSIYYLFIIYFYYFLFIIFYLLIVLWKLARFETVTIYIKRQCQSPCNLFYSIIYYIDFNFHSHSN
jgi:hypothetical protein